MKTRLYVNGPHHSLEIVMKDMRNRSIKDLDLWQKELDFLSRIERNSLARLTSDEQRSTGVLSPGSKDC